MKFGKVLQQSMQMSSSSWEAHWVDYKQLKHIIKDCAHIKKEEKLQGDKLVKTKIKPSAKEDNDSIRTFIVSTIISVGMTTCVHCDLKAHALMDRCACCCCTGTSPDEMNFFRTLRVEIKKIADFFVHEQARHTSQVSAIEQLSIALKVCHVHACYFQGSVVIESHLAIVFPSHCCSRRQRLRRRPSS